MSSPVSLERTQRDAGSVGRGRSVSHVTAFHSPVTADVGLLEGAQVPLARVLVSSCLLGAEVRYHGGSARIDSPSSGGGWSREGSWGSARKSLRVSVRLGRLQKRPEATGRRF